MTSCIRRAQTAALILAVALTVSACSSTDRAPMVDAEHASEQMQSLIRDTMNAAGGKWTSASVGPAGEACTTPDGGEGVWFSWDQDADGPSDPQAVMQRVAGDAEKLGPTGDRNVARETESEGDR